MEPNKLNSYETSDTFSKSLRSYMQKVFLYMGFGLILTFVVAFYTANSPALLKAVLTPPLAYVIMFSPFIFILVINFGINKLQASTAQLLFWLFSIVMGLSLSSIFIVYTGVSIAKVFLISAATFLIMSIYGYITNTDLSKFGSILLMGLIGIIIASVTNIFLKSSGLDFAISIIGVLVFTGLTAWDVQQIKLSHDYSDSIEITSKKAILGALALYLNFINLFLMILRIMGDRR